MYNVYSEKNWDQGSRTLSKLGRQYVCSVTIAESQEAPGSNLFCQRAEGVLGQVIRAARLPFVGL